ncbi:hypothetical protein [Rufibacter radiotolerans]|uniref:hypothetical protein n=1 Tax=Rufibacter radiotolerans TaxID=1379910 RepID=UPI0006646093|nr:hypothetical protein [Rufibacter radiotolerans]
MGHLQSFEFFLGGYFSDSNQLKLEGNVLRCSEYQGFPSEHDKLINLEGNKDWENLVKFLQTCNWKKRYADNSVCDGTQWELKAKGKGINLNIYGSNEYPENFSELLGLLNKVVAPAGIKIR